jgi:hypothetical protein
MATTGFGRCQNLKKLRSLDSIDGEINIRDDSAMLPEDREG